MSKLLLMGMLLLTPITTLCAETETLTPQAVKRVQAAGRSFGYWLACGFADDGRSIRETKALISAVGASLSGPMSRSVVHIYFDAAQEAGEAQIRRKRRVDCHKLR